MAEGAGEDRGDYTNVLSHGLMLALDALSEKDHNIQLCARSFVLSALSQVDRVLDPLLRMLLQIGDSTRGEIDVARVSHVTRRLAAIVDSAYDSLREASNRVVSASIVRLDAAWVRTITGYSSNDLSSAPASMMGTDNTIEIWLRQHTQGSALLASLPANCDYLSAVTIVTARYISARFKSLGAGEAASLRSVAAGEKPDA